GVTLQTLEWVPEERLSWSPKEGLRNFAENFLHLARVEEYYARGLLTGQWDMERYFLRPAALTRETLRQVLNETRAATLTGLESMDPARLDEKVTVPDVPVDWTLRSWLWYLVEHEVHHKAQLALYLREIGVVPPFFALAFPPGIRPDIRG
ncbi:MAG TPA: DinB family protein, partial [Candidatus Eisenbacteria bacterium]|nr:DinB family protein [Candidatus Eisenbacteria bacterium]